MRQQTPGDHPHPSPSAVNESLALTLGSSCSAFPADPYSPPGSAVTPFYHLSSQIWVTPMIARWSGFPQHCFWLSVSSAQGYGQHPSPRRCDPRHLARNEMTNCVFRAAGTTSHTPLDFLAYGLIYFSPIINAGLTISTDRATPCSKLLPALSYLNKPQHSRQAVQPCHHH